MNVRFNISSKRVNDKIDTLRWQLASKKVKSFFRKENMKKIKETKELLVSAIGEISKKCSSTPLKSDLVYQKYNAA